MATAVGLVAAVRQTAQARVGPGYQAKDRMAAQSQRPAQTQVVAVAADQQSARA
jgi:hypothetical protein